ncbi:hypothetical protein AALB39_15025 [Lachnospiraceae bacterium 54-53]
MSREIYFQNVLDIGDLYLDRVLNVFEDENIVFICTDKDNNYYFTVCYEFREKIGWVLCRIDEIQMLIEALFEMTDMYTLFKRSSTNLIEIIYEDDIEKSIYINFEDFNKKFLPTPGVCLKPDDDLLPYVYGLLLKINPEPAKSSRFVDYKINDNSETFNNIYEHSAFYSTEINLKYEYDYDSNTKEFSHTYLGDAA